MKGLQTVSLFLVAALIVGCSSTRVDHVPLKAGQPRHLMVFFDGTNNDEGSRTNISKLHSLTTLQNRDDISATYIKGVGTGFKIIGMGTGLGIGRDVREAYLYLAENYDAQYDDISIYGFSRGAFSARILSSLVYVAGIVDVSSIPPHKRSALVEKIYKAYKDETNGIAERRQDVSKVIKRELGQDVATINPVNIKFLGLWDTVEAFGWPDFSYHPGEPNTRYADQLCNIQYAAQALSIDDNRARVFTPLLLTQKHFIDEKCDIDPGTPTVNEVWFSGAHSDVGGGNKGTDIGGVSLNWMLDQMAKAGLNALPEGNGVYANHLDKTHEGDSGVPGIAYLKRNRDLEYYVTDDQYVAYDGKTIPPLKVHQSVLDRLCVTPPQDFESQWFKQGRFENCLQCNNGHGSVSKSCDTKINAENDEHYKQRVVSIGDNYCDKTACWSANGHGYSKVKSCNFNHPKTLPHAAQRIQVRKLENPGDTADIAFFADRKKDRTGVYLKAGVSYRVSINQGDIESWTDCSLNATVSEGRGIFAPGSTLLSSVLSASAKPLAYAPFTGYMALLGEVAGKQYRLGEMGLDNQVFTSQKDGELILRVNEHRFMETVYENNHGYLNLSITVVDSIAPPKSSLKVTSQKM